MMKKTNSKQKFSNILDEVNHIIYERSSTKQIEYGEFNDSMRIAADILGNITKSKVSTKDFYLSMISLKLSRISHSFKHDTYLDLLAYITALYEYEMLISKTENPYTKSIEDNKVGRYKASAAQIDELGEWVESYLNELDPELTEMNDYDFKLSSNNESDNIENDINANKI